VKLINPKGAWPAVPTPGPYTARAIMILSTALGSPPVQNPRRSILLGSTEDYAVGLPRSDGREVLNVDIQEEP